MPTKKQTRDFIERRIALNLETMGDAVFPAVGSVGPKWAIDELRAVAGLMGITLSDERIAMWRKYWQTLPPLRTDPVVDKTTNL